MTDLKQRLGPFWPFAVFCALALFSLSFSRIALGLWQLERVDAVAGWQEMLLQGIGSTLRPSAGSGVSPPCSLCCWQAPMPSAGAGCN